MNKDFEVKDSGVREEYESGMRRDTQEGKPDYTLIHIPFLTRLAIHLVKGAKKYGENNWKLANSPAELKRFKKSAIRHMIQWLSEEDDEDHMAAVCFNLMAAEYVKDRIKFEGEPQEDDTKYFTIFWKSGKFSYMTSLELNSLNPAIRDEIAFTIPGRHISYGFENGHWKMLGANKVNIFEQIQQKINEIAEITHASDQLQSVMSNSHSTQEDFDQAIQHGIKTLEEIDDRSKSQ